MEKSDHFWQWGNARKRFTFAPTSSVACGSHSEVNKTISVSGGFSLKIHKEGLLERRQCMDAPSSRRSHINSQGNASKSRGPCLDLGLAVQSSTVGINFSKNVNWIEANSSKSPTSVIDGHVSSSDTSNPNKLSCHPRDDLSPELQFLPSCSDDQDFCDKKKPSKLSVRRRSQEAALDQSYLFSDGGSHNSHTACSRETSVKASSSCSFSADMQLQSLNMDEEMRSLRAVGCSESTSSQMDWSCQRPLGGHGSFEIEEEKSEPLEALHMLADVAVWVLKNGPSAYTVKNKRKSSLWNWAMFNPTGVHFRQKRVIRRAKSAFKSAPKMQADALKPMAADSEPLLTSELGSPVCVKTKDEDEGATQSVRSSKRNRSQFLNSKYSDSVLQPLKKGTRRLSSDL